MAITRNQQNDICTIIEKFSADQMRDLSNAVKELIIHSAVNLPANSAQTEMIKDDMKSAKVASDFLDSLSGAMYKP